MKRKNMGEWNYIVWVGDTPDYYMNYEIAKKKYDELIDEGYDDVYFYAKDSKLMKDERR